MSKIDLTVQIDAALLREALAAGLDPAHLLEDALAGRLTSLADGLAEKGASFDERERNAEARAARWAAENVDAISEHNESIARRGLIGTEWRRF